MRLGLTERHAYLEHGLSGNFGVPTASRLLFESRHILQLAYLKKGISDVSLLPQPKGMGPSARDGAVPNV